MASTTWGTWVWVSSRSWWWTGKPGMLQSMRSQIVWHDWATELTDDKIMRTYCIAQGTLLNALWWFQMGRKSKKEGIYVNIWLIHFAIQQKLIHYKATILQWKKKKWNTKSKQKRINQSSKNLVERTVWLIFFLPLSTLPTQLSESLIQNRCPICVCRINICFLSYAKKKKKRKKRERLKRVK